VILSFEYCFGIVSGVIWFSYTDTLTEIKLVTGRLIWKFVITNILCQAYSRQVKRSFEFEAVTRETSFRVSAPRRLQWKKSDNPDAWHGSKVKESRGLWPGTISGGRSRVLYKRLKSRLFLNSWIGMSLFSIFSLACRFVDGVGEKYACTIIETFEQHQTAKRD